MKSAARAASSMAQDRQDGRVIRADVWPRQRWAWLSAVRQDGAISPMARLVAHVLALDFANNETLQCNPSIGEIAALVEASEDTAKRAIKALVEGGWIARNPGRGRGIQTSYLFLTRAQIVPLKGGKNAPRKGGGNAPFYDEKKGANLPRKGGKNAPPYNNDRTIEEPKARTGGANTLEDAAEFWTREVRQGRFIPQTAISRTVAEKIVDLGLLTGDELRAVGVDC